MALIVGIVYPANGKVPNLAPDWLASLSPEHREWAKTDLAEHGFILNDDNTLTRAE